MIVMVSEHVIKYVAIFIIILVGIILFIYLLDQLTGGGLVRGLICSMLFWIPFGSLFTALTQMCAAIPA